MRLRQLATAAGMKDKDYGAVSTATRRFERLLRHGKVERKQWKQLCQKYKNQMGSPQVFTLRMKSIPRPSGEQSQNWSDCLTSNPDISQMD
jgi:hypothetical protein